MVEKTDPEVLLNNIKEARNMISEALELKCTCSGFMLQFNQGCSCERNMAICKAQDYLDKLIDSL